MSWGVAQKQRLAGNDEIDKTVFIKWALKRITKSSNGLDQRLALSNAVTLQKLPEPGKVEQPGFIQRPGKYSAKKLPQARLVVLSACETELEGFDNGEGMIGIARTFLAAGAPLVVASQWPVDSSATAELMIRFHQLRKLHGQSTTSALRHAQLEMLTGVDERHRNPYYWAAFLPVGGYASY